MSLTSTVLRRKHLAACLALATPLTCAGATTVGPDPFAASSQVTDRRKEWVHAVPAWIEAGKPPVIALSPVRPATIRLVTNCNDGGDGSLRAAAAIAVSGDVIDLTGLTCSLLTLSTGQIELPMEDITIDGPGASVLTIDPFHESRIFHHSGHGLLDVSGLRFSNGCYAGIGNPCAPVGVPVALGGCIVSAGSVQVTATRFADCRLYGTEQAFGGAIYAAGYVLATDSEFSFALANTDGPGATAAGGTIFAHGDVYLNRTLIQYGSVRSFGIGTSYGGGLYVGGNLVADHSTIASCSAGFFDEDELGYAGAAVVEGFPRGARGTAIRDSTVSDNHARTFGGLFLVGSAGYSVTITNSTISGNGAYDLIGGIYTAAPTIIANSTIAFNTAGSSFSSTYIAAGLQATGSTLDLQSSIIARNYSPGARTDLNAFHATVTGSNNLIMLSPVSPPDTLTSDPMLGPLVDNGGLTLTHVPLAGSPAIDHGNNSAALPFDQRGAPYLRVFGTAADIGSIESQPSLDRIFSNGFDNS